MDKTNKKMMEGKMKQNTLLNCYIFCCMISVSASRLCVSSTATNTLPDASAQLAQSPGSVTDSVTWLSYLEV